MTRAEALLNEKAVLDDKEIKFSEKELRDQ